MVGTAPSAEDVWFFTLAGIDTLRETNTAFLRQENRVEICRGEKRGLQGVVNRRDAESVDVETSAGTTERLALGDVERVLEVGAHIVVRLGHAKGRSGLILATEGKEVTFVDHGSSEQVRLVFYISFITLTYYFNVDHGSQSGCRDRRP